ncbi:MAG TPA: nitroreductase family protein [Euzebya sp.]|nr:nitroreductase family protein [Euzebya sp.]
MPTLPLDPDELLTTTRAVRKRLDLSREVPLDLVRDCLEVALQAPSGSNMQRWEWLVIADAEQRAAIGQVYRRAYEVYEQSPSNARNMPTDDPDRRAVQMRVSESATYLSHHMGEVPVLVIPCLHASSGALRAGNQAGLWGSILPAAWSYMLAARARGLGTAWTTLHLMHEAEVAQLLGLPDGIVQAALIPTAFYTGDTFGPAPRRPLEEVLHIDGW